MAERSRSRSRPLPRGRCLRIWLSRTGPVLAFTIGALLLGWFSVRDAETAAIRPEYEQTTYAMRGELPAFDDQAFIRALPALERVLPASTRAVDRPLDDEGFDEVVANGMPTLIWTTGAIEVARPSDAGPHRVYEIEAILGSLAGPRVILTFDGPNGPRYLYEIDPEVFSTLRAASGLGATPPP